MKSLMSVARPYVKALFEVAIANNQVNDFNDLLQKASLIAMDPNIKKILNDPGILPADSFDLFASILSNKLNEQVANFLRLLSINKRLILLPEIYFLFSQLKEEHEKITKVQITSAADLTSEQKGKLTKVLEKFSGCKIEPSFLIDKNILGGVFIRIGNFVLDGSLKTKLEKLLFTIEKG